LREAIADYLGSSRGITCTADQVIIVSSTQQALDLLARLLIKPGNKVWMEDPGYFGARIAFETVGAKIVPVPVDGEGLCVEQGEQIGKSAVGAYVTPAHQFPLGPAMSAGRRAKLLEWAARSGAFIIEDDYDSEFRFEGRPIPALMGIDRNSNVILVGSFSKLMFPSLRIGYIVAPKALADLIVPFRVRTDFRPVFFEQAVLADFIERGHLSRHLHKMRDLYAGRRSVLNKSVQEYLSGIVEVPNHPCGLYTAATLKNGMSSAEAETLAVEAGIEALSLDRFTFSAPDPRGLLLGFAAFNALELRDGVRKLAKALQSPR
jgi:GntR family transcriptional regulator/MocR family aminotransferase